MGHMRSPFDPGSIGGTRWFTATLLIGHDKWGPVCVLQIERLSAAFQQALEASRSPKQPGGSIWFCMWSAYRDLWITSGLWYTALVAVNLTQPYVLELLLMNLQVDGSRGALASPPVSVYE